MAKSNQTLQKKKIDPEYRGIHLQPRVSEKERRRRWTHKIFLFEPDLAGTNKDMAKFINNKLDQVVNVYEHTMEDFEFNARKIIKHYKKYYGETSYGIFTIGQSIHFRVVPDQKPFELPLFKFLMNYTMLILPVEVGCDLSKWTPWTPTHWTSDGWCSRMDEYIAEARDHANMRKIGECLELSKYLMNLWCDRAGDRIGLSISNNELIEVMKRSQDAYESITCNFDIPDGISPQELEKMTMERTQRLLKFIGEQQDLSISVYARNKLFNPTQFREYAVHICHKPTLDGNTIPYTYPTNIIMGIKDPRAYSVDAHGGRKAEITKLNVSDAGTLERALMMLMSPVRFVDNNWECNSRHFRRRYVSSPADLDKLNGRVFTRNPKSNDFWILDPKRMTDLIGETIYLKTPITCTHPRRAEGYICSACYGKLMASLNCDLHVGRLAAAESADEIEQKLLSAKHALNTDTVQIEFDDMFYEYFELGNGQIVLSSNVVDMAEDENNQDYKHLFLEFYPHTMKKNQDGESRHFDRSFQEIVIYNDRDESRISISEKNGATLYLSPEFNDNHFLPALHYRDTKEVLRVPFSELCDPGTGKILTQVLFEFSYKNNELASPLLTLEKLMFNCESIASFPDYDECLNTIIPLFVRGGIHIPDYQTEMLVSRLITAVDGGQIDWNDPHPQYTFQSINKAIFSTAAPLTSILYRESGAQIAGDHGTYGKSKPDSYTEFIIDSPASPASAQRSEED